MNLDIFLPFHKKTKKGEEPPKTTWFGRGIRRGLPASFFSDPVTGKKGAVRRVLQKIGTTWHSSPWRHMASTPRAVTSRCSVVRCSTDPSGLIST